MPGQVQHLERDVTEVDGVALDQRVVRPARRHGVGVHVVTRAGQRGEQLVVVEHVADVPEVLPGLGRERPAGEPALADRGTGEVGLRGGMRVPVGELVERADVVEVVVGRDRRQRPREEVGRGLGEADDPEAAVDEQRPVPAANEPDVAAQERVHGGLGEVPGAVVDASPREPVAGRAVHQPRRSRRGRNVTAAPVETLARETLGSGGAGAASGSIVIVHASRSSPRGVAGALDARRLTRAGDLVDRGRRCITQRREPREAVAFVQARRVAQREAHGAVVDELDHRLRRTCGA